jgi:hypothetical protein
VAWFDIESDRDDNIPDTSAPINIAIAVGRTIQANKRSKLSVIGLYTTFDDAVAAKDAFDEFVHNYKTRYKVKAGPWTTDPAHTIVVTFTCRSHKNYSHILKIKPTKNGKFELLEDGWHDGEIVLVKSRQGIAVAVKSQVDSHLLVGIDPMKARTQTLYKHMSDQDMLLLIPTVPQIANRKAYLKRTFLGGWEITTFAFLMEWASSRMCHSADAFLNGGGSSFVSANELVMLDCFQHEFVDQETQKLTPSFGLIFSSRSCLYNIRDAVACQGDNLALTTDGSYRLHFGGWTLVDCCSTCVVWENQAHVHRFVPFVYMFVRAECAYAYEKMFRVMTTYATTFFGLEVNAYTVYIDLSDAIARAIRRVWPCANIITCWPHLVRKSKDQVSQLNNLDLYEASFQPDLYLLHSERSQVQFDALAFVFLASWRRMKESGYAEWFEVTYLSPRWTKWFVTAAVPDILPSQQPIESHHAAIKDIASDNLRAPTAVVLNMVMPKLLLFDGSNRRITEPDLICEGLYATRPRMRWRADD